MRKLLLIMAAAAPVLAAGSVANRADAMTAGRAPDIRAVIEDIAIIGLIHCTPGRRHHTRHLRPTSHHPLIWDGCTPPSGRPTDKADRPVRPPVVVQPNVVRVPRGGWCHVRQSIRQPC